MPSSQIIYIVFIVNQITSRHPHRQYHTGEGSSRSGHHRGRSRRIQGLRKNRSLGQPCLLFSLCGLLRLWSTAFVPI